MINNALGRYGSFAAYGFSRDIELPRREGSRVRYTFPKPDGTSFGFDNFWLAPRPTRGCSPKRAWKISGSWIAKAKPSEGQDPTFWQAFLNDCPITGLAARRPG